MAAVMAVEEMVVAMEVEGMVAVMVAVVMAVVRVAVVRVAGSVEVVRVAVMALRPSRCQGQGCSTGRGRYQKPTAAAARAIADRACSRGTCGSSSRSQRWSARTTWCRGMSCRRRSWEGSRRSRP